ncbi:uncharacterized protein LOC6616932 isoform X1 [Drosophila sechellia]|uniref:GM10239 n=1 Tax=Drosophila sechellia TaxID=7238 RepID=B4ICA4_DROSE|nr:uncharacterized protein LOC6616932 isoform X1 [Drosophila sechellia]XP_032577231.1 uncharacterized protein LOC6616932 isoform X1 [Drosophila sechellia]XP_032577232.1 uncharacterized protein LOC6616932 isoform X1 [Drosophila sechellia]EDW45000.1 GM10239 [Drosophila sechellia]
MITRIAFYILPVLVLWSLIEIEGLPSAGDVEHSRKNQLLQDELFINCCRILRRSDPSDNCLSCEEQFRPMEPVTEASRDVPKTPLGVPCSLTHRGCYAEPNGSGGGKK